MSARRVIALLAITLVGAAGLAFAPRADAEPCSGAAASVRPANAAEIIAPSTTARGRPIGQKPRNAQEQAPKPKLRQIPIDILRAFLPKAPVQQRAAVVPQPQPQPTPVAQPPVAAQPIPETVEPAAAPVAPGTTTFVGWVTGPDSPGDTVNRFAVTGTDLGIMWDSGDRQVLVAFGDTYGACSTKGQQWRYNVLFRTADRAMARTINVSGAPMLADGIAKQVLYSTKWAPTEVGIIPTAGIAVGRTQYMSFMSIKSWDSPGQWTTNYSAIATSTDNGDHWAVYPSTVRTPRPDAVTGATYAPGNENFQMGAFMKPGPGDPYLYSYGTPSGRSGSAYVARVAPQFVPDPRRYEYWNSDRNVWVPGDPGAATAVIPGPVGEMSAQFNTHLNRYLVLYCNGANDVVARSAPAPQGPWSPEQVLVPSAQFPGGIYAPYLHPWSTGRDLFFNMSIWSDYNVMLMKTSLP